MAAKSVHMLRRIDKPRSLGALLQHSLAPDYRKRVRIGADDVGGVAGSAAESGMVSEAPEIIYIAPLTASLFCEAKDPVQAAYRRADLAGLPEELVERLREAHPDDFAFLVADVLHWHEQQKGGGE